MSSSNKESKDKKSAKDDSRAVAPTDGALLRRIADELAVLRAEVDGIKLSNASPPRNDSALPQEQPDPAIENKPVSKQLVERLSDSTDAAVTIGVAYRLIDGASTAGQSSSQTFQGLSTILDVEDSEVARLAYAFSSAQKVSLVRALLLDGAQSATQLGEKTSLTTGSLYHHLRELTHAGAVETGGRNRVTLTPQGCFTALVLFAIASKPTTSKRGAKIDSGTTSPGRLPRASGSADSK